jgi:thiol-disulfide isomerase/thioredoxin
MRRILPWSMSLLAAFGLLCSASAYAGDKDKKEEKKQDKVIEIGKEAKVIQGELSANDPIDKMTKHPSTAYMVKLTEGKTYKIDMVSGDLDSFLRLEDAAGKQLAFDDDGGGFPNARIVQEIAKSGEYKIIATSFDGKAGKFTLTIRQADAADALVDKVKNLAKLPAEERKEVVAELKKTLAQSGGKIDSALANGLIGAAVNMEYGGQREVAGEMYADFGKLLAGASDPNVARGGRMMEGAVRRFKLIGNPMTVHGQTLQGKEFDWKNYKGKVVLVDFWAVWCGPCRAEIPNIIKMYEKYHDQGFEVVGISIDNTTDAPTQYMDKEKMPWTCVHDPSVGKDQPKLSEYYGVFGIPMAILVDRDGRVVSTNARGPELARLLEKHIGPGGKGDKDGK